MCVCVCCLSSWWVQASAAQRVKPVRVGLVESPEQELVSTTVTPHAFYSIISQLPLKREVVMRSGLTDWKKVFM